MKVILMRYTASGKDEAVFEIGDDLIQKYPDADKSPLVKRQRIYNSKKNIAHFEPHLVEKLIYDSGFIRKMHEVNWVSKSFKKYTSNFYLTFITAETEISENKPKAEKTKKVKGVKKEKKEKKVNPIKEKKKTFKNLRTKLNNKIKLIKTLDHFIDPLPLKSYYHAAAPEREQICKTALKVFKSYRDYFEELLISRNIPFYVCTEYKEVPFHTYDNGLRVEYVLVNNSENVPVEVMNKQSWSIVSLVWSAHRRTTNPKADRWSRIRETVLTTKKIGLGFGAIRLRKSDIKSFKTMRESSFTEWIDTAFKNNNEFYRAKIDDFKSVKTRVESNKTEEEELKDFIREDLISVVPSKYIENTALDLRENDFTIVLNKGRYSSSINILEIGTSTDDVENLSIKLNFFGVKTKIVKTASEAIALIEQVMKQDLRVLIDTFGRAETV